MSYKDLKSYQQATVIYDFTVEFCNRYMSKFSRTVDQMVQAARSGKQNIVEGVSNRTSEKSELKLLGVARASFTELLEDYEDFLRQKGFSQWQKNDTPALQIRNLVYAEYPTYLTYKTYITSADTAANVAICLIHQVNYLLDQQIKAAESKFLKSGGYTENLFKKRLSNRSNN